MILWKMVCSMLLVTFLSILALQKSEKRDGYKFPVYSTQDCPRNATEWKTRSTILNCTEQKGYTCLPNEHFTELLEFCYTDPHILIEQGLCLYLIKSNSLVNGYRCHKFQFGCPSFSYLSTEIYDYPSCIHVENGCFIADRTCRRTITTNDNKATEEKNIETYPNKTDDSTATYLQETTVSVQREIDTIDNKRAVSLFLIPAVILLSGFLTMLGIICKRKIQTCRQKDDIASGRHNAEKAPFIEENQHKLMNSERDDIESGKHNAEEDPFIEENQPKLMNSERDDIESGKHNAEEDPFIEENQPKLMNSDIHVTKIAPFHH